LKNEKLAIKKEWPIENFAMIILQFACLPQAGIDVLMRRGKRFHEID